MVSSLVSFFGMSPRKEKDPPAVTPAFQPVEGHVVIRNLDSTGSMNHRANSILLTAREPFGNAETNGSSHIPKMPWCKSPEVSAAEDLEERFSAVVNEYLPDDFLIDDSLNLGNSLNAFIDEQQRESDENQMNNDMYTFTESLIPRPWTGNLRKETKLVLQDDVASKLGQVTSSRVKKKPALQGINGPNVNAPSKKVNFLIKVVDNNLLPAHGTPDRQLDSVRPNIEGTLRRPKISRPNSILGKKSGRPALTNSTPRKNEKDLLPGVIPSRLPKAAGILTSGTQQQREEHRQTKMTVAPLIDQAHQREPLQFPPIKARNSSSSSVDDEYGVEDDNNVQVMVRLRPLVSREHSSGRRCLQPQSERSLLFQGQDQSETFTFDHVADEHVSQEEVFQDVGLPMVDNCLEGYNSTLFAYGQTGSGKTYTMIGDIDDPNRAPAHKGIIPRVYEYLFKRMAEEQRNSAVEQLQFTCTCSFLEIYNEQITDLLDPSKTNLHIREDPKCGHFVEGLTAVVVDNLEGVMELLLKEQFDHNSDILGAITLGFYFGEFHFPMGAQQTGKSHRKVATTFMNEESSRSHTLFIGVVKSTWIANNITNTRYGRLNLVDLAGSERQKCSGAIGERLREASNINKSLSCLGLVIMILVEIGKTKRERHVPYRDSKLTLLLQDSLGGNSKTKMIANISPSYLSMSETWNTLKFAQRAKYMRTKAVVNEDASGDVEALQQEIRKLKEELSRDRSRKLTFSPMQAPRRGSSLLTISQFQKSRESLSGRQLGSPHHLTDKVREVEAVLTGVLRREQLADEQVKRLTDELEQLSVLSTCQAGDQGNAHSTEFLRLAAENSLLKERLQQLTGFYEGGEKEALISEVSSLKNTTLELLKFKANAEQLNKDKVGPSKTFEHTQEQLKASTEEYTTMARELDELQLEITRLQLKLEAQEVASEVRAKMDEARIAELEALVSAERPSFSNERDDEGSPSWDYGARRQLRAHTSQGEEETIPGQPNVEEFETERQFGQNDDKVSSSSKACQLHQRCNQTLGIDDESKASPSWKGSERTAITPPSGSFQTHDEDMRRKIEERSQQRKEELATANKIAEEEGVMRRAAEKQVLNLENDVETLKQHIQDLDDKHREMESELEYLKEEVSRERDLSFEAGKTADDECQRRQKVEMARAAAERELHIVKCELEELRRQLERRQGTPCSQRGETLRGEPEFLKDKTPRLKTQNEEIILEERDELERRRGSEEAAHRVMLEQLEELKFKEVNLQGELDSHRLRVGEMEEELNMLREAKAATELMETELKKAQERIQDLEQEAELFKEKQMHMDKIGFGEANMHLDFDKLRAENEARQQEIFRQSSLRAAAVAKNHDMRRQLLEQKLSCKETQESKTVLGERLQALTIEKTSLEIEIARLKAEGVTADLETSRLLQQSAALAEERDHFLSQLAKQEEMMKDLEEEVKKLEGQQNLKQRIHHHEKIKVENRMLKIENEKLSRQLKLKETRIKVEGTSPENIMAELEQ